MALTNIESVLVPVLLVSNRHENCHLSASEYLKQPAVSVLRLAKGLSVISGLCILTEEVGDAIMDKGVSVYDC